MQLHSGQFKAAAMLVDELEAIAEATEDGLPRYGALALAGWRVDESDARQLGEAITDEALHRGEGMGLSLAEHTNAVLHNGLGQYEQALAAAEQASNYPPELGFGNWSLVELIEAAVRSGAPNRAEDAVARLIGGTGPSGTDWALGVAARSRALLADDQDAERLYLEAMDRLGQSRGAVALARARLIYGEWLRWKHRRTEARDQLRRRARCSSRSEPRHLRSGPGGSCSPRERESASATSRRATTSRRRRHRSRSWPQSDCRTLK